MRRIAALAAIAALTGPLVLGGCTLFDGDDEEEAATVAEATAEGAFRPVEQVRQIEIGRTRNGLVITAYGIAPGVGYARPQLRPRREGQIGPDGYLDYDFVARPPVELPAEATGLSGEASARARQVRADELIDLGDLRGARGIRIHAAEAGMMMNF